MTGLPRSHPPMLAWYRMGKVCLSPHPISLHATCPLGGGDQCLCYTFIRDGHDHVNMARDGGVVLVAPLFSYGHMAYVKARARAMTDA